MCDSLSAAAVTSPYYTYNHSASIVSGDGCGTGSSSISGMAFLPSSSSYPSSYDNGLFFTDYSRNCIWFMPADGSGNPTVSGRVRFANLTRAGETTGGAVSLTIAPDRRPHLRRLRSRRGPAHPLLRRQRPAGRVLHGDAIVRARAPQRVVQRERLDRRQRRHADLRLGSRWRRPVRRRDRGHDLANLQLGRGRGGRPEGHRYGRRVRHDDPDRVRRQLAADGVDHGAGVQPDLGRRPDRLVQRDRAATPRTGRCPPRRSNGRSRWSTARRTATRTSSRTSRT